MYGECIYVQSVYKVTPLVLKEFYFKRGFWGAGHVYNPSLRYHLISYRSSPCQTAVTQEDVEPRVVDFAAAGPGGAGSTGHSLRPWSFSGPVTPFADGVKC